MTSIDLDSMSPPGAQIELQEVHLINDQNPEKKEKSKKSTPKKRNKRPKLHKKTSTATSSVMLLGESESDDDLGIEKKQKRKPPRKWIPFFTILLAVIQIVMLIITLADSEDGFTKLTTNPLIGPDEPTLIKWGAKKSDLMRAPYFQLWRLISAMVLHAGVLHLVGNLVSLNGEFMLIENSYLRLV